MQSFIEIACNFLCKNPESIYFWVVFYLCGVIELEWGLLCYSPEMGSHLLFIALIIRVIQFIIVTCMKYKSYESTCKYGP